MTFLGKFDSDYQILPDISKKLIIKKSKIGEKVNLTFDISKTINAQIIFRK